jgi:hypothetical protein
VWGQSTCYAHCKLMHIKAHCSYGQHACTHANTHCSCSQHACTQCLLRQALRVAHSADVMRSSCGMQWCPDTQVLGACLLRVVTWHAECVHVRLPKQSYRQALPIKLFEVIIIRHDLQLTRAAAAVLASTLIRLACWRLRLAHVRSYFTAGVGGAAGVAGAAGVLV